MTSNDEHAEHSGSSPEGQRDDEFRVVDNPEAHRYEGYLGTELAGFLDYHTQPGLLTILHTEIDRSYEGRGIGSRLVADVLDDIRRRGMEVLPICPFVIAYIKQHPEYTDLLRFQ
jgi:uncharacterized protein